MKLTVVFIAVGLSVKIEKLPEPASVLLPGEKTLLFPVKVTHIVPSEVYKLTVGYASDAYDLTNFVREKTLNGSELTDYLQKEKLNVPYVANGSLQVKLDILNLNTIKNAAVDYELKSPSHIILDGVREKTDEKSRLPLRIANVTAPFDTLDLEVQHNGSDKDYNLTIHKNTVELHVLNNAVTGTIEYTVKDKASPLQSQPQQIVVVALAKGNKRKLFTILMIVSVIVIVLMLVAMVVQIKFRPFSRKNSQQMTAGTLNPTFGVTMSNGSYPGRPLSTN